MSKKSKSKTVPWKKAQAPLLNAASSIQETFDRNQGANEGIAGTIRAGLPRLAERAFGENQFLKGGQSYVSDVLGGRYLDSNKYLNDIVSVTRGNVADQVNGMFSAAGRTGSDRHQADLSRGLAEAELGLRYGDYGRERDIQGATVALVPGMVNAEYAGISPLLLAATSAAEIPFTGSQTLGGIGSLLGGFSTTTQKKGLGAYLLDAATAAAVASAGR